MSPRPRTGILDIAAYVGGASKVAGQNRTVKLSSNEGAFGTPPGAQAAWAATAAEAFRYPDGGSAELRQAIGARFGLDPARIVCGAGSDELIYLLTSCYGGPGTELMMTEYGFSIYEIAGKFAGCRIVKAPERNLTADVDAMLAAVSPATRLVFLANPNNPTGTLLPAIRGRAAARRPAADVLLVLDAAYAEYVDAPGYDPGVKLVDAGDNTVMTRTFSKIFGLGGVRVGWCYAPPAVVDVLNRVRSPFNVNLAAQAAADRRAGRTRLGREGARPQHQIPRLAHRRAAPARHRGPGSDGNFMLADFGTHAARRRRRRGAARRAASSSARSAPTACRQCLRITVGTAEECALVAEVLGDFVARPVEAAHA